MIPYKITHLQQVNSTNTYLKEALTSKEIPEGTVILSDFQNLGRGTGQNKWVSEEGKNLTLSILLRPRIGIPDFFSLVEFVSLALIDVLAELNITARIKWPNDIYVDNKKIAGILIENTIDSGFIILSVVGIGLNINQESFPDDIPNPVSVKMLQQKPADRVKILSALLSAVEKRYQQLKENSIKDLHREYLNHVAGMNQRIKFMKDGKLHEGVLSDITRDGMLFIRTDDGDETGYLFGEIHLLL